MKKEAYTPLTAEELYALEKRARQARARYVAIALKSVYERVLGTLNAKVVRHAYLFGHAVLEECA